MGIKLDGTNSSIQDILETYILFINNHSLITEWNRKNISKMSSLKDSKKGNLLFINHDYGIYPHWFVYQDIYV